MGSFNLRFISVLLPINLHSFFHRLKLPLKFQPGDLHQFSIIQLISHTHALLTDILRMTRPKMYPQIRTMRELLSTNRANVLLLPGMSQEVRIQIALFREFLAADCTNEIFIPIVF